MKKVYLLYYILALALTLTLSSCSRELTLLSSEWSEIAQFFTPPSSDEEFPLAAEAGKTAKSSPVLIQTRHAELLPSPYNKSVDVNAVTSVGNTDKLAVFDKDRIASNAEKFGYTNVSFGENLSLDSVSGILEDARVLYNIEYKNNSAPAGDVFAMEYAGFSCSDGYFINPDVIATLYVSSEKPAKTAQSGDNLVYITFDDGPTEKNTTRLLEILDTYGVKAAFFTTGDAVEKYPDSAREIVERGHIFGCHSRTHDYKKIYASTDALAEEVDEWEKISETAGITKEDIGQLTFRFPGGSVGSYFDGAQAEDMKKMLADKGYFVYDWNVVTNDSILYMAPDGTRSYDYLSDTFRETLRLCINENKGKSGAPVIILMHETVDDTVELLPWMLEYLISEGYTFGDLGNMGKSWTFADR